MATLTPDEKERVMYHLGYMGTGTSAAALQFGVARPVQTMFLLQSALELLTDPYAVNRVRRVLFTLDTIEQKLQESLCSLIAEQLGNMKLREHYPDLLEKEYVRWARRLADIFGVPLYAFSDRFRPKGPARNVPVSS